MGTQLVRSNRDKKIMGVCGGIAEYLHIDSTLVRIIWAVAVCCFGSPLYHRSTDHAGRLR